MRVCVYARLVLGFGLLFGQLTPLHAAPEAEESSIVGRAAALETERRKTATDLAALSEQINLSEDAIRSLDGEIQALAADRRSIRQAMIDAAAQQKATEVEIAATERRIKNLADDESGLKSSLRERRGLLAEVLGALQRMGRKPPPALLVRPDDALGSVRSAILLGAVVPRIREETATLAQDLDRLTAVKREIATEKQRFVDGLTRQREDEARLARLFEEKERLEAGNRDRRQAESRRVAELAAEATSLEGLIETLEKEADGARRAEKAARRVAEEKRQADIAAAAARQAKAIREAARRPAGPDERSSGQPSATVVARAAPPASPGIVPPAGPVATEPTYDIASLRRDMPRIEAGAPFSTMKGRLSIPVTGEVRVGYGQGDGIGRPASGMTFTARAGDLVTAPADGQVLFSGPFRSYGQLLILNAGDGYHVVLAGMNKVDVDVGQFVLSGEPVAVMGARRLASTAGENFGAAEPSLYVEFRKDGKPVDPSPWWRARPSGRTRNDS